MFKAEFGLLIFRYRDVVTSLFKSEFEAKQYVTFDTYSDCRKYGF